MSLISVFHPRAAGNPPVDTRRTDKRTGLGSGSSDGHRETLSPLAINQVGTDPRRRLRWLPRLARTATVVICLVVPVGAVTMTGAAAPAVSATTPTAFIAPSPSADPCIPDSPLMVCPPAAP